MWQLLLFAWVYRPPVEGYRVGISEGGARYGLLGGGAIFSAARASWSGVVDGKGVDWIRQYFVAFAWPYWPPVGGYCVSISEGHQQKIHLLFPS
jgi:hypothetical protein